VTSSLIGKLPAAHAQGGFGFRNVGTWNMQGSNARTEVKWQSGVANLMGGLRGGLRLDVLALQEAGAAPPGAQGITPANVRTNNWPINLNVIDGIPVNAYTWLGTQRPGYYVYWINTDPNGNRVNVAIVTRRAADEVITFRTIGSARTVLGVRFGLTWYYTVHARSGIPNDDSLNNDGADIANAINDVTDYLGTGVAGGYRFVALGDWNRDPGELIANPDTPLRANIAVDRLFAPTYPANPAPQRNYDYLVTSNTARFFATVLALYLSDHYPKVYQINPR
jgi:hypothetical protein